MKLQLFSYKTAKFQITERKLPELELQMSHSFEIKIVSRKKLFKVLASPQAHFQRIFSVSKSCYIYEISQLFFAILKFYLRSIHMANNFIAVISFGFKLNSNLNGQLYVHDHPTPSINIHQT